MNQNSQANSERREYFRIDDSLHLTYRVVSDQDMPELKQRLLEGGSENFSIMADLSAINQKMSACMRRIELKQPDVASYLRALDKKVEILGRNFFSREAELSTLPARAVNLSGNGFSIRCRELHQVGENLEIKILLEPSYSGVVLYGIVVSCDRDDEDDVFPYSMRIHFTVIRASDQDALIRHVLARQSKQLREEIET